MGISINQKTEFYNCLGCIMYAIANADKKIVVDEKLVIKQLLEEEWLGQANDFNGKDVIVNKIREFIEAKKDAEVAFSEFELFFQNHHDMFSLEIKRHIMSAANRIASSFSGKNKSELILLKRLHNLLLN